MPGRWRPIGTEAQSPAWADGSGSVPPAPAGRERIARGKSRVGEGRRPGWGTRGNPQEPQRGERRQAHPATANAPWTLACLSRPYRAPGSRGAANPGRRSPGSSLALGCHLAPGQGSPRSVAANGERRASPNEVSDGRHPTTTFDWSLSESAGSRPLDRLGGHSWDDTPTPLLCCIPDAAATMSCRSMDQGASAYAVGTAPIHAQSPPGDGTGRYNGT
jgi:hypothetical protein